MDSIRNRLSPDAFGDPAGRLGSSCLCDTVTITTVFDGPDSFIGDVAASADGDTIATIPHLIGAPPEEYYLVPILSQALTALSGWAVTTVDATNVVLTKLASAGSGNAAKQVRLIAKRPHTLGR